MVDMSYLENISLWTEIECAEVTNEFFIVAHVGQIQTRVFDDMFFKVRRIRLNGQKDE